MLFDAQSPRLAALIAAGRGVHDAAGFQALKEECERWKPSDYDAHQNLLRHQYEGNISPHLSEFARGRFPNTGSRMPLVPLNWAALYANNGAAVYDYPPTRYVERDGERVEDVDGANPADVKRADEFAVMVDEARLEVIMAEAERRVVLARTVFLRVHSDSLASIATGKPPRTVVTPFWPGDVLVLPHPRCPASLETAIAIMARVSSDVGVNGGGETWEVWTRTFDEDEVGNVVSFGRWRCELVTQRQVASTSFRGTSISTDTVIKPITFKGLDGSVSEEWPLQSLPWVVWHSGIADGSPFLDANRNLVQLFDTVNASMMSEVFAVDMNAAAILYRKSDAIAPRTVVLGPGAMPTIKSDESIDSVPMGADFAGMRASNNALVATLAMTSRQSASDYDATGSTMSISGVAIKIKNEPQAKARIEATARARDVEARLLPIMVEVHDYWRATSIADPGITFCMEPAAQPAYEDAEVTQRRAIDAKDAGLISEYRAAVECGYYRTEEDARTAIEAMREVAAPSGMRAALDAAANAADAPVVVGPAIDPNATAVAVADTALNGAQVSSLLEIVSAVATGILPKSTAQAMIAAAFPSIGASVIGAIVGPVDEGSQAPTPVPLFKR